MSGFLTPRIICMARSVLLPLLAVAILLPAACARRQSYDPQAERLNFENFEQILFEGMTRRTVMNEAGRKPVLTGVDLDYEYLTFRFHTPGEDPARHFRYITVVIDRDSETLVRWE